MKFAKLAGRLALAYAVFGSSGWGRAALPAFFQQHCVSCHDADTRKGNLDLTSLKPDFSDVDTFGRWVSVYDRIASGEMPPKKKPRPTADEIKSVETWLSEGLMTAERARLDHEARTTVRRLTRIEYENTVRDLFNMPGAALQSVLPADGMAHGFDKNSDALDISHVLLAKYIEAADKTLDLAIATQAVPPNVHKHRMSLMNNGGFVTHIVLNGDGVLLKDKKIDPDFPPAGEFKHVDEGAHQRLKMFPPDVSVGLFRHEDESVSPYFMEHVTIYPGAYRVRTSFYSFQWDKGQVLPARGTEAARLSVVQLTGNGTGGQHPSYVLGYYDAPSLKSQEHELTVWLNQNELIGFNAASLAPVANYARKGHAMAFTGPGLAVDWMEIEGPLNDQWPTASHKLLFGDLPIVQFKPADNPKVRAPVRSIFHHLGAGKNRPDPVVSGIWTVKSDSPLEDADRLLANFLPRAFRRPVDIEVRKTYLAKVAERLAAGDCFETAMRWVYKAALCSPDFLYHVEPVGRLDDYALASRLSYFFWNSTPDRALIDLAEAGKLHDPKVLDEQVERLLADSRSARFVEDFLGQWLKLRQIGSTDPDKKLYPEFSPYLQDSMVAETKAYFRELIDRNLDARYLVKSDFAMLNEKLAVHYGISGVTGSQIRRVQLPEGSVRGPFLAQASLLKITANGTTTSPVPRGAFVMARILGRPPEPPPPNVPAVEPDVRGSHTIREQLDKHRSDATCAACHSKIDPVGFALESFDVIGGFRTRYRCIGDDGEPAPRGNIDPMINIKFNLGPAVDASGQLPDGRKFGGINELETVLAADPHPLLQNLAQQLSTYATGREVAYSDRQAMRELLSRVESQGGGVRTLLKELVKSSLFQTH